MRGNDVSAGYRVEPMTDLSTGIRTYFVTHISVGRDGIQTRVIAEYQNGEIAMRHCEQLKQAFLDLHKPYARPR